MNLLFGIRPTSEDLHIGHISSLIPLINEIKHNGQNIDRIILLMAEKHAEISNISIEQIKYNSEQLVIKIISFIKQSLKGTKHFDTFEKKTRIVYQRDLIEEMGVNLAFSMSILLNVNKLTRNPVFQESTDDSVGFMLYPVLQAFDVFLFSNKTTMTRVFLGKDQTVNVNIMKEIGNKLQIDDYIQYSINKNVIYDSNNEQKMSKSLNNYIIFDNFDDVSKFIKSYKTCNRPKITDKGDAYNCPFNNSIIEVFKSIFNFDLDYIDKCNSGEIGCGKCKQQMIDEYAKFINGYNKLINNKIMVDSYSSNEISDKYYELLLKINYARTKR